MACKLWPWTPDCRPNPLRRPVRRVVMILFASAAFQRGLVAADLTFDVNLASLTGHNTSAFPEYNQSNFPKNFGTTSYVSRTETVEIDPAKMDRSMMPVTPGHVSGTDVHTLIPSRPDLRWFAHLMPWYGAADQPIDIGLDCDTDAYVKSLIADLMNRGFNGVMVCWNGKTSRSDSIARRIQAHLKTLPAGKFTFLILMDEGLVNNQPNKQQVLEEAVTHCNENYFGDPNYEREDGKPILMFFGVRGSLGSAKAMAAAKAAGGGDMVWAEVGTRYLNESWQDQCYDWSSDYKDGVDPADPYKLSEVKNFYSIVKPSPKKAIGAMCASFNGTLTGRAEWSLGKHLPSDNGRCLLVRAQTINQDIPPNVTRMQWVTWNDWPEGSAVEPGIENDAKVTAKVKEATLNWTVTGGTGDESTIDHYEIYASVDGVNAAKLGSVPAGTHSFDLASVEGFASETTYHLTVVAVGKPCIRNHASKAVEYRIAARSGDGD